MGTWPSNPVSTILQRGIRIVTAAGAVTVTPADGIVEINKTVGAATAVTLPAAGSCIISDGKGDAGTNNITVTAASGNISGAANFVIATNGLAKGFVYDGTQWLSI